MDLWLVALVHGVVSDHPLRMCWELVGIFSSPDKANLACVDKRHCFWRMDLDEACHTPEPIVPADAVYPRA